MGFRYPGVPWCPRSACSCVAARSRIWKAPPQLALGLLCATLFSLVLVSSAAALPTSFGSEGDGAGQLSSNPQGIAVEQESGDVYVSDPVNNRIEKFGREGEFMLAFGWGVADGESEELQTCTSKCFKGLKGSGAGEFDRNEGIAVDNSLGLSHGDIYVIDQANSRVQKFSPNGEFLTMFGSEGTAPGQFEGLNGRSIAVDSTTGTVYVADENRVQRFSEDGAPESEVSLPGVGLIQNLALDSTKDIYLHGSLQAGVHKYDSTGKELGSPRDEAGFGTGLAITIGPGDELFVNEFTGVHHILSFNDEGELTASFDRGELAQNGSPGIAYNNITEAIYVLNGGAVRIVTPPPPGPFVLLASESATEIEPTSAKFNAAINPEGAEATYHFQYVDEQSFQTEGGFASPNTLETSPASLAAVNQVQTATVKASEGFYVLRFQGEATKEISFNAPAAEVQSELEALSAIGAGNVSVTGGEGGPYAIEFTDALGASEQPQLQAEPMPTLKLVIVEGEEERIAPGTVSVATTTPAITLFNDRFVSAAITGLQPGTTYHFRAVAGNGSQTTLGPDETFSTLPAISINGTSTSAVNATSARLEADLNPHGLQSEYRFEYDTSPYLEGQGPHGVKVPVPDQSFGQANADTTVANAIQQLTPQTTYHYRVIAHNALGTVTSSDHSFKTQGPSSILADNRSWEQVSPPNKHGAPLQTLRVGPVIKAAAGGGAFTYAAESPVEEETQGSRAPTFDQLLSTRSASAWSTQDIATPHEEISEIRAGFPSEYRFFAEDLSASVVEPEGVTPLSPETSERTPYRREANGQFVPLVTKANVPVGTKFGGEELEAGGGQWAHGVEFRTATPDLAHVVLASPQVLAPGFEAGFEGEGRENLYELSGGQLTLVSVLPDKRPAAEAGFAAAVGQQDLSMRGAIASDGGRVVFEAPIGAGPKSHLYLRDTALAQTLQLDVRQPGAPGGEGVVTFQAASEDGTRVFFTDDVRLTADATAKTGQPDLYMCEVQLKASLGCALSDLSVDPTPGQAANVQGVSAIDEGGGHVYFTANGVLTSAANARGEVAVPGSCNSEGDSPCNLYEYDTAEQKLSLVAVLSSHDDPDWAGRLGNLTARSSPGGRYFTFMSRRSLSGYDNRDVISGEADEEVFLYDAESGGLSCVSCDPSGARPQGMFDPSAGVFPGPLIDGNRSWSSRWLAASVPGWTLQSLLVALYQPRYLSDSGREFFNATDALVPQDTNKVSDIYEFEPSEVGDCSSLSKTYSAAAGGCVNLISSGSSNQESAFLDASESGDEAFFLTAARLTGSDVDGAMDVYDAHVCSDSSPCPPPPPPSPAACEGDSCQNPSQPPPEQTPASLTYKGPENPPPPPAPAPRKAKPKVQLLAKALKACRHKKPKHKRVLCERQARKKYAAKKAGAKKAAKGKKAAHAHTGRRGR